MFDLLVRSGDSHGAGRTIGPVNYGARKQYDYFVRQLDGIEPPDWGGTLEPATDPASSEGQQP